MGSQGIPHSPGMQHPNFGGPGGPGHPGGPTSNPGMPGQPQNFPQMNGQWPPQVNIKLVRTGDDKLFLDDARISTTTNDASRWSKNE